MTKEEKEMLDNAKQTILLNKDIPGGMDIIRKTMNDIYRYFKRTIIKPSYKDEKLLAVFKLERLMEKAFLPLKSDPIFDPNKSLDFPTSIKSEADCLQAMDYIVHETRKRLNEYRDVKTSSLEKDCVFSSGSVKKICESKQISQKTYQCKENLDLGLYHCFNIVTFNLPNGEMKVYLIDCTYRQFFTYSESFLERIGMPLNSGPNMGAFMLMDESRTAMAEELLTKGYIEFTPENIKHYFDGFVFSGRNGFYYDRLGKKELTLKDYEPNYTWEEYLHAINNGGLSAEIFIGPQYGIMDNCVTFDTDTNNKKGRKI